MTKVVIRQMRIAIVLFISLYCFSSTLLAAESWDKLYKDASIDFEIGDYVSALEKFNELFEMDSTHAELNYRMGICHFSLRRPMVSMAYFQRALREGKLESYFYMGQIYHLQEEFDMEITSYQKYKNIADQESQEFKEVSNLIESANYAKEMIQKPANVDIVNVGENVNTPFHEYAPLVYGAETELFFTSRREGTTGGGKDPYGNYFEDVYVSKKDHGQWQKPIQLNPNVNTTTNDACVGISADGQILYIFRTNDDLVSGDLLESRVETGGWGEPKKLGSQINSDHVESSACISNDERVLYFSSNRPGGFGGKDLYRVVKLPTGEWSLPQNLGPTINTAGDEDAPFIHVDDKTLYFSSNGHKSIGGFDIYESQLNDNGLWSQPLNMGYPVNTVSNDMNFVMSPDKQNGYYSSAQAGGYGGQDIYVINFKLYAQVLSVVKGSVISGAGGSIPLDAKITLIDGKTRNVQGIYKTNDKTGKFIMVISPEKDYTMVVEAEGYHTYSKQVSFNAESLFANQISEINLIPTTEVAEFE